MGNINVPSDAIARNILDNSKRGYTWLDSVEHKTFNGRVAIVCGAPSMKNKLDEIRALQDDGVLIWSVNGSHDFLVDNGVKPDFFAMVDARHINDFCDKPQNDCVYLIASQCNPKVFRKLSKYRRMLWHCAHSDFPTEKVDAIAKKRGNLQWTLIGARKTIGLCSAFLAYTLGFRDLYLYGMDSSFTDYQHSYTQKQNEQDTVIDIEGYKTTPTLAQQADIYPQVKKQLQDAGVTIHMRSEGLIKAVHEGKL